MTNITIRSVLGFIPVPIFWSNRMLKEWQGGVSYGFFCVIRPIYRDRNDNGIVQHELRHCYQFYTRFPLHSILYSFNRKYRLRAEMEAYAIQLTVYGGGQKDFIWMVDALYSKYNLGMERDEILSKFREYCLDVGAIKF
jgi:hypothetical protein